ncbi:HNH endonuclease signature motif containing protein [Bacillus thuringiensis]|uniref:HNH endonuclease signature motif containing protein n=1 Tax=Bacillus thuringiensis TaxID=1428 RepID=UPI00345827B0
MKHRIVEYNDNKIAKLIAQYGKCAVTNQEVGLVDWHCHHKIPLEFGGQDNYRMDGWIYETKSRIQSVRNTYTLIRKSYEKRKKIAVYMNVTKQLCCT